MISTRPNRVPRRAGLFLATFALLCLSSVSAESNAKFNRKVDLGQPAPDWKDLPSTDGRQRRLSDYANAKAVVLVFTCNHCPVAQAYENRLIELTSHFKDKGVAVVAISCSLERQDRMEKMKQRAKERGYNFDYLKDESQQVGRDYGATVTPHVFVLDQSRKIAYMGAIDDSRNPEDVTEHYLRDAIAAVLAGQQPEVRETLQFGCAVVYR